MTGQEFNYLTPYFLSALISLAIGLFAFRRRSLGGAFSLGLLAIFEAEWTLTYTFQELSPGLAGKLFWNNLQFLGAVLTPFAYCEFGLVYSGIKLPRYKLIRRLTAVCAVIVLAIIWTDGWTHLFRTQPHIGVGSPFSPLIFADGPLYLIFTIFGYGLLTIGTYALIANFVSAPRIYRLQIATVLVGILIPWVTTLVTWLDWVPVRLHDVTPLTFAVSNMVVGWALFRYQLFDLVPVAHHTLVENMEEGVIVADSKLRIADMNPAAQHIFGVNLNGVLGKSLSVGLPLLRQIIPAVLSSEIEQREVDIPMDEDVHVFEIRISSLHDNRELPVGRLILMRDITGRKRTEEKLQLLAITDPLTGIFNRRYFFDMAEREFQRTCRSGEPLSVILVDVDRFKRVNDTFGHSIGDVVLQNLTRLCRESIRTYDVMARYGGEEFVILLPKTGSEEAFQVAERLRSSVAEGSMSSETEPGTITISLGVASLDQSDVVKFDQLLDRADVALYTAKRNNRNCVCLWSMGKSGAGEV